MKINDHTVSIQILCGCINYYNYYEYTTYVCMYVRMCVCCKCCYVCMCVRVSSPCPPVMQKEVALLVEMLNSAKGPYSHYARNLKKLLDGLGVSL